MPNLREILRESIEKAIVTALTRIPRDVYEALRKSLEVEVEERAKYILETMLKSVDTAIREGTPLCQDTGVPVFYIELGDEFPIRSEIKSIILEAVEELTKHGYMRPNAVHPLTNINSGNNIGRMFPVIEIDTIPGDAITITFLAKGGGSEYVTKLYMVPPSEGLNYIKKCALEAVLEAGPRPCPPVILSIGIGGTADMAIKVSRRSLAKRRIGSRHEEPQIARLELELLEAINSLGIGPAGLGGKTTALDVWIDYGFRHPATYAIAITFSCWCLRKASITIDSKGNVVLDPLDFWTL